MHPRHPQQENRADDEQHQQKNGKETFEIGHKKEWESRAVLKSPTPGLGFFGKSQTPVADPVLWF
ncbi:MAG: hypothetical protein LAT83_21440, partial [Kiritimatiellae bacterium]|nr:hypothetical protein [Kiritimatiellia bacterium]